jgi:hypothetical protein
MEAVFDFDFLLCTIFESDSGVFADASTIDMILVRLFSKHGDTVNNRVLQFVESCTDMPFEVDRGTPFVNTNTSKALFFHPFMKVSVLFQIE